MAWCVELAVSENCAGHFRGELVISKSSMTNRWSEVCAEFTGLWRDSESTTKLVIRNKHVHQPPA